jgi:hypothetical protein
MGTPVSRWALATPRKTISFRRVTPGASEEAFIIPALAIVPAIPSRISRTKSLAYWSGSTFSS